MHVIFVTSEVAGIYKIGGLADVSQSLPKALGQLGHTVTVILPFYSAISADNSKCIEQVSIVYAGKEERVDIHELTGKDPGVRTILVKHSFLSEYQSSQISEVFTFFSIVAANLCSDSERYFGEKAGVVHCHDWHTALVPILLSNKKHELGAIEQSKEEKIPTILTIHNLLYTGNIDGDFLKEKIKDLDCYNDPGEINFHEFNGKKSYISLLRDGLEKVTIISTVSPTYAKEITSIHDIPIEDVLVRRKSSFFGILNGIDMEIWNPQVDHHIQYHYEEKTVDNEKKNNKNLLQKSVGLSTDENFLIGFVGRIEPHQKGIDLVLSCLSSVISGRNIQMIFLGTGEDKTEQLLKDLANKFPDKILFINAFDDKVAHQIYAGCDALLVPSKFEPCGLTQLIAMRYGTLPIVRKTGGLADTVSDMVTGFVFDQYDADQLAEKILTAHDVWLSHTDVWRRMVSDAMNSIFSWEKSARTYIELYERAQGLITPTDTK